MTGKDLNARVLYLETKLKELENRLNSINSQLFYYKLDSAPYGPIPTYPTYPKHGEITCKDSNNMFKIHPENTQYENEYKFYE